MRDLLKHGRQADGADARGSQLNRQVLFVINALMFWSASGVLDGFHVQGFGAALVGSLIYSMLGIVIDLALQRLFTHG